MVRQISLFLKCIPLPLAFLSTFGCCLLMQLLTIEHYTNTHNKKVKKKHVHVANLFKLVLQNLFIPVRVDKYAMLTFSLQNNHANCKCV